MFFGSKHEDDLLIVIHPRMGIRSQLYNISSNGSMTNPLKNKKTCCDRSWHMCSQEVWAYQSSFGSFVKFVGTSFAHMLRQLRRVCFEPLTLLVPGSYSSDAWLFKSTTL